MADGLFHGGSFFVGVLVKAVMRPSLSALFPFSYTSLSNHGSDASLGFPKNV
jgi:hypothetical protein